MGGLNKKFNLKVVNPNNIESGFDDIQGLDELSFVERYAWFSFDATQLQSAASALFYNTKDTSNQNQLGVLTDLGNVYRNECGNPLHYTLPYLDGSKDPSSIEEDRYIEDQFHHDVIQGDNQTKIKNILQTYVEGYKTKDLHKN